MGSLNSSASKRLARMSSKTLSGLKVYCKGWVWKRITSSFTGHRTWDLPCRLQRWMHWEHRRSSKWRQSRLKNSAGALMC